MEQQSFLQQLKSYRDEMKTLSREASVPSETTSESTALSGFAHKIKDGSTLTGSIFLGQQEASAQKIDCLKQLNITAIVNCTPSLPCCYPDELDYCSVPVNDEIGAVILPYLWGSTAFIHDHLLGIRSSNEDGKGGSVLVHCQQGISRSSTVVIAYLIRYDNKTLEEALISVKSQRCIAQPNLGFWKQLKEFETYIREGRATDYPPPLEMTEIDFNFMKWVKRSTAIFSTIGSKNRNNCDNLVFSDIMPTRYGDRNNVERIFNASLGYVWSRGLNECDMKCTIINHFSQICTTALSDTKWTSVLYLIFFFKAYIL